MSPRLRQQRPPARPRLSWARGAGKGETRISDPEMGPRSAEPTIILRPYSRFGTLHPHPGARCTADGKLCAHPLLGRRGLTLDTVPFLSRKLLRLLLPRRTLWEPGGRRCEEGSPQSPRLGRYPTRVSAKIWGTQNLPSKAPEGGRDLPAGRKTSSCGFEGGDQSPKTLDFWPREIRAYPVHFQRPATSLSENSPLASLFPCSQGVLPWATISDGAESRPRSPWPHIHALHARGHRPGPGPNQRLQPAGLRRR